MSYKIKTHQKVYLVLKRAIDIFGSVLGIMVLSPLILDLHVDHKMHLKGTHFL
jgi:lipopolysaccharide/colanic/teichoic acid biosynthesis glycosyltransferase